MQPQSPTPQPYDFIFKDEQKPKKKLLPNLSGPVLILAAAVGLMLLIIIISVLFLGRGKSTTANLIDILGRAQEISRVNTVEQNLLKDPNTLSLLATTQIALSSEQTEINSYAKDHKIKIDPKKLESFKDQQTDSKLTIAAQNNNLDNTYTSYLKQALSDYSNSIAKAYSEAKDTKLKKILSDAYISTQTLLGNPPKST